MKTIQKRHRTEMLGRIIGWATLVIIMLFCLLCFGSCRSARTITVEVPVPVHDTMSVVKEVRDSTYVDRWHTICQKGDTIYITNEVTKTKYVTRIDTAYKVVERPVTVTRTETVEVKNPLYWWQKTLMWFGAGFILVIIGSLLFMWLSLKDRT